MTIAFTLPKWTEAHAHLRQDELLPHTIKDHLASGCANIIAMPNTKPPLTTPERIQAYLNDILKHGGDAFENIVVPLYLSQDTTAAMIESGAKSGILKSCKYYPPHGTTGAEFSADIQTYVKNGVLQAMSDHGVILNIHGEMHGLEGSHYFDAHTNAEKIFYRTVMPSIRAEFPDLKIVGEHLTTKAAVDFVTAHPKNTAATVTPQHLIYTVADLLKGLKYHLYCLPLLKFDEDRHALREAVTNPNNTQFFAGTDSAPHTTKATECGCAAGCYTAAIGPQLYAEAFELAGIDLSTTQNQTTFKKFMCDLGAEFYGFPLSNKTFTLSKAESQLQKTQTPAGELTPLPLGLGGSSVGWRITF